MWSARRALSICATSRGAPSRRRRPQGGGVLIGEKEETLPQLLFGDRVRAPMIVLGKLTHRRDVAALRPCGEPPQLHILQHPLSQTGHGDLLSREVAASLEGDRLHAVDRINEKVRGRFSSIRRRRI